MMRSPWTRLVTLAVLLIAAALLLGQPAYADDTPAPTCDVSKLKGVYSFNFSGTVYDAQWYTYLLSEIGFITFDGAGNFTGTDTYNFDGAATRRKLTGTYTVNTDCTGTITINASDKTTINGDIAVVLGGKEVNFTQTDSGWIFSGVMKLN